MYTNKSPSVFLNSEYFNSNSIKKNFLAKDPQLSNLLLDDFFRDAVHECQAAWRAVIAKSVEIG